MEATLEPRLVMKGEAGTPYVEGEFFVASYQRGYRWGREEVRQLLDDIRANAKAAEAKRANGIRILSPFRRLGSNARRNTVTSEKVLRMARRGKKRQLEVEAR